MFTGGVLVLGVRGAGGVCALGGVGDLLGGVVGVGDLRATLYLVQLFGGAYLVVSEFL